MKVLCITLKDFTNGQAIGESADYMRVGDKFTVITTCIGYGKNDIKVACYDLLELTRTGKVFDQRNFAPLSDLDETELVTEEFKEKHYVPA